MPIPDDDKVRRGQRAWFRHQMAWRSENYQYSEQLLIAERIDRLELAASPYQDPFEPVKPSLAWRAMRLALATLAIVFIFGSLPVLGIGLEIAEEIFRSLLGPTIFSWIQVHPSLAFVAFIVLGILMGLLTWWVDKLKDTLGGQTES